jgi:ParB/RepB/Spo0J family partition protein
MKINVKELDSNPFRNIEQYPIDRAKVEALKTSIESTSFWDNIIARKKNGRYQIAYGHHRLIAIKELRVKQVDIPIRKLDDATMLRIMAEENIEWSTSPAVINETVYAVKNFLDGELAKYKDWKHVNKSINMIFASNSQFQNCKKRGVGQTIILKFLGKNWQQWKIQQALETLKDGSLDRAAVESFPTMSHARAFRKAVKHYEIPKIKQKALAEKILKDEIGSIEISNAVRRDSPVKTDLENDPVFMKMERLVLKIDSLASQLRNKIMVLRGQMKKLNVEQLEGVEVSLAKCALKLLFDEMKSLTNFKG